MHELDYQVIDAIEASVYWKDLEGKYLGCNKYMQKMAGLPLEAIIGQTDYTLPWQGQAAQIDKVDRLVLSTKRKYELEETATLADGTTKVYLSSKSPLFDDSGAVIGVIGVSIDITHNKKVEQEFRATEQSLIEYADIKNRFLKNIRHESRIPLSSVLSIAESLKENWDSYDDAMKRDNINLIWKESKRLSQFVLNTFDMSSFLKNEIHLDLKKQNFSIFVKQAIQNYKTSFCNEKIDIQVNASEDCVLAFDHTLITRVIDNLLMNAIQYSPKHKKITVSIHSSYLQNSTIPAIQCSISDEGVGVPADELDTIFDSFTESSRTASKACGVGLGLSVCKEIIEVHSGNIWVENNSSNSGTTFHFRIPKTLLCFTEMSKVNNAQPIIDTEVGNVLHKNLSQLSPNFSKKPFALIGISPFNSYFSSERIEGILEWVHNEYDDFGIFIPDQISKYTLEALGYEESRIRHKIRKQDNYTKSKVNNALDLFYKKYPKKKDRVNIHTISSLKEKKAYLHLYKTYSDMFYTNKEFRIGCLDVAANVLLNNGKFEKENTIIEDAQKNIAVQYFLCELPVMVNVTQILPVDSCDFIYQSIPKFLKQIYSNKELVPENQRFLILE